MKRKIGLLFVTLMTSLLALVNVKVEAKPEVSPAPQTLEVKDVLEEGAIEGSGRVVRRVASPAANHKASQAYMQVTAPTADGKVNVRFVAGIDSAEYAEAQLKLEMFDGNTSKGSYAAKVTTAYTAMVVNGENQTAAQVFGEGYNYIVAYTMKNMPRESWENGFKASVGLKLAGEETFTETAAEEVKNVKAAIMADNHLVFSWKPWGDHVDTGSVIWENDFVINDLAPEINREDYEEDSAHSAMFKDIINAKMRAEATMENGDVYYSSNVAIHNCQAKNGKHVSVKFANLNGIDLRDSLYTIKFYIELSDGTEVVGVRDFTQLPSVENASFDYESNTLSFAKVNNATMYKYRIFNDEHQGNILETNTNSVYINPLNYENGTYNVEIIALSDYHVASDSVVFENIITIENVATLIDATHFYDIEIVHQNNGAWEGYMYLTPLDDKYILTGDNLADKTSLEISKNGTMLPSAMLKGNTYSYYEDNRYVIYFSHEEGWSNDNSYRIKFLLTTDLGAQCWIDICYSISANDRINAVEINKNYYIGKLLEHKNLTVDFIGENNLVNEIYENSVIQIHDLNCTIAEAANIYEEFKIYISANVSSNLDPNNLIAYYYASSGKPNLAFDGDPGTRWESSTSDPQYIIAEFICQVTINSIDITWETARSKEYTIDYSTDGGDTWITLITVTNAGASLFEDGSDTDGNLYDHIEFNTPIEVSMIRINGTSRTTQYGHSIWEVDFN